MCLFSQVNHIEIFGQNLCFGQIVLVMRLFFRKKSLHVVNWPCAYKKMSVAGSATLQHFSVELYFRTADVIVNTYLVSAG